MIVSMTGFGHGAIEKELKKFTVDIRSVNGKFLDLNIRIPRQFMSFEDDIRKIVSKNISRGSVDIFVNYFDQNSNADNLKVDLELASKIKEFSSAVAIHTNTHEEISAKDLLRFSDVLSQATPEIDLESLKPILIEALNTAIIQHSDMRNTEGKSLEKDLRENLKNIELNIKKIEKLAPSVSKEFANKLKQKIEDSLKGIAVDESRLLTEIAIFVDKSDINEEIVRLKSHIKQFEDCLKDNQPAGRRLEFLVQEMLRETNTIGSKANNLEITNIVLSQKNELEKIKEQIRNVE